MSRCATCSGASLRCKFGTVAPLRCWPTIGPSGYAFSFGFSISRSHWTRYLPPAEAYHKLRDYFFRCPWYEVYDFIEFVANECLPSQRRKPFEDASNKVFKQENSAYRFVDGKITRITDEHEIEEIELALTKAPGPVKAHLRRALELASDRRAPDYRNSIKESISAVESLVSAVVGEKGTLGQLIKKLRDEFQVHPALCAAFEKLYGYTSDESGIRHALMELEKVGFDEAKFLLVVCSAFANYVQQKCAGGG